MEVDAKKEPNRTFRNGLINQKHIRKHHQWIIPNKISETEDKVEPITKYKIDSNSLI